MPRAVHTQETFEGHRWRLVCDGPVDASELCMPAGDAELRVEADGFPEDDDERRFYHHRVAAGVAGVVVKAAEQVAADGIATIQKANA